MNDFLLPEATLTRLWSLVFLCSVRAILLTASSELTSCLSLTVQGNGEGRRVFSMPYGCPGASEMAVRHPLLLWFPITLTPIHTWGLGTNCPRLVDWPLFVKGLLADPLLLCPTVANCKIAVAPSVVQVLAPSICIHSNDWSLWVAMCLQAESLLSIRTLQTLHHLSYCTPETLFSASTLLKMRLCQSTWCTRFPEWWATVRVTFLHTGPLGELWDVGFWRELMLECNGWLCRPSPQIIQGQSVTWINMSFFLSFRKFYLFIFFSSFTEVCLSNKSCIYLGCTAFF